MSSNVVDLAVGPEGVAVVTLDRPEVHNSFNRAVADRLVAVASELAARSDVGAVVITGRGGRAFCAGADIAEFGALDTPDEFFGFIGHLSRAVEAVAALPQIVIAAVEGVAFGGGCELAMACDLRVASSSARFGLPEVKLGLLPGLGGTQRAVRLLPRAVALRLLVTGDPLMAEEAHRLGFCEPPVEPGTALEAALEMARNLCAGPRAAIAAAKRLIDDGGGLPLGAAIGVEQAVGRDLFGTADAREGISAFLEKRAARFGGGAD